MMWFSDEMVALLNDLAPHVVVIGSVARGARNPGDLDLLFNGDSEHACKRMRNIVDKHDLRWESALVHSWTFEDYGTQVEILPLHLGPSWHVVRRNAEKHTINGIELMVAKPEHSG